MIEGLRPGERPLLLEAQAQRFRSKLNGDEAGFRAAAALFRELETPFWLAVTLLEHGEASRIERRSSTKRARSSSGSARRRGWSVPVSRWNGQR